MSHYKSVARILLSLLLCLLSSLPFSTKRSSAAKDSATMRDKASASLRIALDRNSIDYFLFQATPTGLQLELTHRFAAQLGRTVEIVPVDSVQQGVLAAQHGLVDFYATSRPLSELPHALLPCSLHAPNKPKDTTTLPTATWLFPPEKSALFAHASLWLASKRCKKLASSLNSKFGTDGYMRLHFEENCCSRPSLSAYDSLIKKAAASTRWDWRWIASIIYQESRFKPSQRSLRGAYGLMQMTPITAKHFRVPNLHSPKAQIEAGVNYLLWLDDQFEKIGIPIALRNDFILAAYNAGYSRIRKAQANAEALGDAPNVWVGNVAVAHAQAYRTLNRENPIATLYGAGETCNFVQQINCRYAHYKNLL